MIGCTSTHLRGHVLLTRERLCIREVEHLSYPARISRISMHTRHTEHPSRNRCSAQCKALESSLGTSQAPLGRTGCHVPQEVPSWTLGHGKATQAGQEPDSHHGSKTPCPAEGLVAEERCCSQEDEGNSGSCRGPAWQDWGWLHQPRGALRAAPVAPIRPKTSREAPGAASLNLS